MVIVIMKLVAGTSNLSKLFRCTEHFSNNY